MSLRPSVLLLLLCIFGAGLSGCVESDGEKADGDDGDRDASVQNQVVLEDLKRCLWPKGDDLVECENRVNETVAQDPGGEGICVARFSGTDEGAGARLRWHGGEGNHSLHYWSESNTPVFGIVAVSHENGTDHYNWNRGGATGVIPLPGLPEQANVSVLIYRTWLQSGGPVPANLTFRVDWDFVEGVDAIWPVRVLESDGTDYHLQPAMEIPEDAVFKRQWHDFMEVEGEDFHWVVGYKKLVRGDQASDTRTETC